MKLDVLNGPTGAPALWAVPSEPRSYKLSYVQADCDAMLVNDGFLRLSIFTPDRGARWVVQTTDLPPVLGGAAIDHLTIGDGLPVSALTVFTGAVIDRQATAPIPGECWIAPGETLLVETLYAPSRLTLARFLQ